jgi:hypothetical protein
MWAHVLQYLSHMYRLSRMPTLVSAYGTAGIASWIQSNVVSVIILVGAVAVLWAARGGNIGKGITICAGLILGVAVLGLANGTTASDLGTFIVHLFQS